MSNYKKVIYLDGEEGRPLKECKICKKIERNVIEPVAIFASIDFDLDSQNPSEKERIINQHNTCIFHCEKENQKWIENYNEGYKEYAKRREETINKGDPFKEDFKIEWNEDLVKEFWRRIRAYRFAVDYKENWESLKENWKLLRQHLSKETLKEIEEDKNIILSYLEKDELFYDLRNFIFPKFTKYDTSDYHGKINDKVSRIKKENIDVLEANQSLNFWFAGEILEFKKIIDFWKSTFIDRCFLIEIIFEKSFDFSETKFYEEFDISRSFISDSLFQETVFYKKADFISCKFKNTTKFLGCKFYDNFDLSESKFDKEAKFLVYGYYDNKENKVEIQNLIINSVYNYSETIRFYGVKVKNLLKITNTSLKNLDFNNLDLTEAEAIVFRNVSFDNCILNNIHWGEISEERINIEEKWIPLKNLIRPYTLSDDEVETKIDELKEKKIINDELMKESLIDRNLRLKIETYLNKKELETLKEEKLIELRDIYRQLKLALDKQEDHITANEFYALEMKAYKKTLDFSFSKVENWKSNFVEKINISWIDVKEKKNKKKKIEDFLVLFTYGTFSNFGQSFLLPFISIFLISYFSAITLFPYKNNNISAGIYPFFFFFILFVSFIFFLYGLGLSQNKYRKILTSIFTVINFILIFILSKNIVLFFYIVVVLIIIFFIIYFFREKKFVKCCLGSEWCIKISLILSFFLFVLINTKYLYIHSISYSKLFEFTLDLANPFTILNKDIYSILKNYTCINNSEIGLGLKATFFLHKIFIFVFLFLMGIAVRRKVKR